VLLSYAQNKDKTVRPRTFEISADLNYSKYWTFEEQIYSGYTYDLTPGVGYSVEVGYSGFSIAKKTIRISTGIDNHRGKIMVEDITGEWYQPLVTVTSEINQSNLFIAIEPLWVEMNGFNLSLGMVGDFKISDDEMASIKKKKISRYPGGPRYAYTITEEKKIGNNTSLRVRLAISEDFNLNKRLTIAPRLAVSCTLTSPFKNTHMKIYRLSPMFGIVFKLKPIAGNVD